MLSAAVVVCDTPSRPMAARMSSSLEEGASQRKRKRLHEPDVLELLAMARARWVNDRTTCLSTIGSGTCAPSRGACAAEQT